MTADLPDVAKNQVGQGGAPLDWVGMENISLPVVLSEASQVSYTSGSASVFVNVPSGPLAVKGIHMSRLYQLLNTSSSSALTRDCFGACWHQPLQAIRIVVPKRQKSLTRSTF